MRLGVVTITYPAMFPPGTPNITPNNVANRVPGQINTNTGGGGTDLVISSVAWTLGAGFESLV